MSDAPAWATTRYSANERIDVAVIGIGMRGKYLIANLPESFRVTALCDCSLAQIDTARHPSGRFKSLLSGFAASDGKRAKVYQDYRKLLEKPPCDAVIIAAPDHHHAGAAILAMQAGCDVYVEKPLATTIAEGRAMVEAAQRSGRVVQVGSQQRTMAVNRRVCEFIRNGGLGKVTRVIERNLPGAMPYEPEVYPAEAVPAGLDWDLFCGPTPLRSHNRHLWVKDDFKHGYLTWRGWDLFEDYSGHLMTNWGAHSVDMVQYALGKDLTGPREIRLHPEQIDDFTDDQWHQKTPPLGSISDRRVDRMRFCPLSMRYDDGCQLVFSPGVRKTTFTGEKGRITVSRNDYQCDPVDLLPPPTTAERATWDGDGHVARPHLQNWESALRDGTPLNAPIETGHRSITVCHLANIARKISRDLRWDPNAEQFDDANANQMLSRPRRGGFELPTI